MKAMAIFVLFALVLSACTGSSAGQIAETPTAEPIETPAVETPDAETPATETPEVSATPAGFSDQERIAAAIAEFETNPQPEGLFAYDILDTSLSGNGVIISLCAWTGETVFDEVRQATYRVATEPTAAGDPDVTFESTTATPGECLNSALVESALQATRDYDNYWRGVLEDPTTFDETEALLTMSDPLAEEAKGRIAEWVEAGVAFRSSELDGLLPQSSLAEVLGRRWVEAETGGVELISCRVTPTDFGLYKGEVLIDDFKNDSSTGEHTISRYRMVRENGMWKLFGAEGLGWADCFAFEDGWFDGVNQSFPEPAEWVIWES